MRILVPLVASTLLLSLSAAAQESLTPAQAAQHIGQRATVCGTVASTRYASGTRGEPTFVNLDKPWPHPIFTIVVWGDDRARFDPPPERWKGHLCVTGRIISYHGQPEIKVSDPAQASH